MYKNINELCECYLDSMYGDKSTVHRVEKWSYNCGTIVLRCIRDTGGSDIKLTDLLVYIANRP